MLHVSCYTFVLLLLLKDYFSVARTRIEKAKKYTNLVVSILQRSVGKGSYPSLVQADIRAGKKEAISGYFRLFSVSEGRKLGRAIHGPIPV